MSLLELELIGPVHGWNWEIKCISLTEHMVGGCVDYWNWGSEREKDEEAGRRRVEGR